MEKSNYPACSIQDVPVLATTLCDFGVHDYSTNRKKVQSTRLMSCTIQVLIYHESKGYTWEAPRPAHDRLNNLRLCPDVSKVSNRPSSLVPILIPRDTLQSCSCERFNCFRFNICTVLGAYERIHVFRLHHTSQEHTQPTPRKDNGVNKSNQYINAHSTVFVKTVCS